MKVVLSLLGCAAAYRWSPRPPQDAGWIVTASACMLVVVVITCLTQSDED